MTRRKEELDNMTTSDLDGMLTTQIAEEIQETVREKRVGRELMEVNDSLVGSPGNTIRFLKRGQAHARPVGESEAVTKGSFDSLSYSSAVEIAVQKFGAAGFVTRESIDDAREDIVNAVEDEIADALADMEDQVCLAGLAGATQTTTSDTAAGSLVSAAGTGDLPWFLVTEVYCSTTSNQVTDYSVDYASGAVTGLTNGSAYDVTYWNVNGKASKYITSAASTGDISAVDDLLTGIRNKIASRKYSPDTLVVNDTNLGRIMSTDAYIDESKYGGADTLHSGELGKVFGMSVIVSSQLPDQWAVAADTSANPGVFVLKEDVRVETDQDISKDDVEIIAYQRYNAGLKKEDAVQLLRVEY